MDDEKGSGAASGGVAEPGGLVVPSSAAVLPLQAVPAQSFLSRSGLGFLGERFKAEGFLSVEDVLELTPRKYEIVGVETLGAVRLLVVMVMLGEGGFPRAQVDRQREL